VKNLAFRDDIDGSCASLRSSEVRFPFVLQNACGQLLDWSVLFATQDGWRVPEIVTLIFSLGTPLILCIYSRHLSKKGLLR
jgi:hypothetical protein